MVLRLTVADAAALNTQSPTTPAHTVAMIVLGASEQLTHDRLGQLVADSLPRMSKFRSRLLDKPFGVGQPVWVEVDDYDPAAQICSVTVSEPGGEGELAELVTQLGGESLDRRGPLWKAWTISGLSQGRWALVVKMSPVLAGTPLWQHLLTADPNSANDQLSTEAGPGPAWSAGGQLTDVLSQMLENQVTGVYVVADAVTGVLGEIRRRLSATDGHADTPPTPSMRGPIPKTPFNAPLTTRRSIGLASIPLADVKTVSDAFGGNTANVLLAACTLSLREWLRRYDTVPAEPLLMEVPLTVPAGDPVESRHSSAVGQVRMPVQLDDPVQILTNLHTATERLNIANSQIDEKIDAAIDLTTVVSMVPPVVAHTGMRIYSELGLGRWRA
ncbi:MAG: wax ester/triacylglycerol synthase family O-acyltransferase, partial [Dietzia sp.]|nr:wax ester/triacylglycerol synthase family O-acyltransferase [Dietzia sp.]